MKRDLVKRSLNSRDFKTLPRYLNAIPRAKRCGQDLLCEVQAIPCPPTANFRTRPRHAAGKMLEMPNRIAKISSIATN